MLHSAIDSATRAQSGVAVTTDKRWRNKIQNYIYFNRRIIIVRFKIDRRYLVVVGVYTQEEGRKECTKIRQYFMRNCRRKLIKSIPTITW